MNVWFKLEILVIISAMSVTIVWGQQVAEESMRILPLTKYEKTRLPKITNDSSVVVEISYKITGVHDLDLKDGTVLFGTYFRVSWVDSRLVWPFVGNLTDDGREELVLDSKILSLLWLPDVYIEYSRSVDKFSMLQDVQSVSINKDRRILVSTMMGVRLSCSWNFHYYPFDVQHCEFVVASYGYTKKDIIMTWMKYGVTTANRIQSQLTAYDFEILPEYEPLCFCRACINEDFACIKSTLVFKRRYMARLLAVYVPSAAMVFVSWLSFFWPPDIIPGRTMLVITSLLTLLSMDFSMRTIMPETGYMKAVDVWMFSCIFMVVIPILQYGVVIRIRRLREEVRLSQVKPSASSIQQELTKLPLQLLNPNKHILNTTEKHTRKYLLMEMIVERVAIVLHPIIFLCINLSYWTYYLTSQQ